ncbi:hypothetical protein C7212DRAFT_276340 [Tuber magnatum]|uniref:Zn(2)-C6 fungal-type domain-containing protein n=1 Tax=Tuber magnatum TaxID=42249 RepID=A0A317T149_9PEZI|nr:hypothetical protein C7212DRAFT_276340 [Tuber magnatum]
MPKLFLPPRKISEPSNNSVASSTPVDSCTRPSLDVSSSLPPANVPAVNPNTLIPPRPAPNTGIAAPTPVLSLSPLSMDGNPHVKAVPPPAPSRPSPSSNRRKGPPRLVACVSCHRQKKKCGGERPCTRCVTLGVVCREQERPHDGFQYIRKKKLKTGKALDQLPQLPIHPLNHPTPFPGSLWASMAQQASCDNPTYQNQLPSPSPSLTMVPAEMMSVATVARKRLVGM